MHGELMRAIAETDRRLASGMFLGTVAQADYSAARVRVQSGDQLTTWIPWLTQRAGSDRTWWAPEVGEQVLIVCPQGDPAQAVVVGAIFQNTAPPPAGAETVHRTVYADGTVVEYDRDAQVLTVNAVGKVEIVAAQAVNVTAPRINLN